MKKILKTLGFIFIMTILFLGVIGSVKNDFAHDKLKIEYQALQQENHKLKAELHALYQKIIVVRLQIPDYASEASMLSNRGGQGELK